MTGTELRARVEQLLDQRPDRAWDLLVECAFGGTAQERSAAWRFLPYVAAQMPAASWGATRRGQLRRLRHPDVLVREPGTSGGTVAFPVVAPSDEAPRFVTARVRTTSGDRDILPELRCPEASAAVRDALAAARALVGEGARLEVTLDEEVHSNSLGLAVALAAVSELQGFEIEDRFIATGRVSSDRRVKAVGHTDAKIALRAKARPQATLLIPTGAGYRHPAVLEVANLEAAVRTVRETISTDPAAQFDAIRTKFENGDWRSAAERGEALRRHPALDDDSRLELLSILLCGANHQADTERAEDLGEEINALLSTTTPSESRARAIAAAAVTHIDRFNVELARAALAFADDPRHDWSSSECVHLNGTLALLAVLEGDLPRAVELRRSNLELASPSDMPRCLGDLADVLRRKGDLGEAQHSIDRALDYGWKSAHLGYVQATLPYLCLHAARIALAREDAATASRFLRSVQTDIPELRYRAALETHVVSRDVGAIKAARTTLPPGMDQAVVIRALQQRALLDAGDHFAGERLACLMNLPKHTSASELRARLPY